MATLADFNAKLTLLGLPTNETMGEGSPFTAEESDVLATCRRECGAPAIDAFSSSTRERRRVRVWCGLLPRDGSCNGRPADVSAEPFDKRRAREPKQ